MKLKKASKVFFDRIPHKYYYKDKELVGVTTLLKKHGLSPDYSGIPEYTLKNAAERGTQFHSVLEDYDNGMPVTTPIIVTDLEGNKYDYTGAFKGYKKLGLNVIASEYLVSDKETVASFIDKVIEVDENTVDLGDVKTTSELHKESLSWQLSVYAYLFEMQNPGKKVRNLYGLHGREKKFECVQVARHPDSEVAELLRCEREGETFSPMPEGETSLDVVLTETEITEYVSIAEQYTALKNTLSLMEKKKKEYDARVLEYMNKEGITTLDAETGQFRLRKGSVRTTLDTAAIKENYPEIAEKYSRQSETAPSLTFVPYAVQPE